MSDIFMGMGPTTDAWAAVGLGFGADYTGWKPSGNDIVKFSIIEAPDDRYIPGYSREEADGDKKTVMPRLKDLNVPFSLYGIPIPITWGVRRLYGNIIWAIPLKENIKKANRGKGKGGPEDVLIEYKYYATFAVAFGMPGNTSTTKRDILRIWLDGSLSFDRTGGDVVTIPELSWKFYHGTNNQAVDPIIEEREGVGQTPAFRNLMYMRFVDMPVQDFGNRPPAVSIEIGDATAPTYNIKNFDPTTIAGDKSQGNLMVDWETRRAITVSDSTDVVRTYDLDSGELIFGSVGNQVGIGWNGNPEDPHLPLGYYKGFELVQCVPNYFPWLELFWASAQGGSAGSKPIGLFDPMTGEAVAYCGAADTALSGSVEIPPEPSPVVTQLNTLVGDYDLNATIPRCIWLVGVPVYNMYGVKTVFFGQGLYGDHYILTYNGSVFAMQYSFNGVTDWDTACAGKVEYGVSTMYTATGTQISKWTLKYDKVDDRIVYYPNIWLPTAEEALVTMTGNVDRMLYVETDNSLVIWMGTTVKKYLIDEGTVAWTATVANQPGCHHSRMHLNNIEAGTFGWQSSSGVTMYELDLITGEISSYASSTHYNATGMLVDTMRKNVVGVGISGSGDYSSSETSSRNLSLTVLLYDRATAERMPLADFIRGMALYAGYTNDQIEIDATIDDMIDGAIIAQITSYRTIINPLLALYRIDLVESEGKVKFRRRDVGDSSVDFAVADGDTIQRDADGQSASFVLRREEEVAVPQRVNVRYLDSDLSYNWSMQFATRSQFIPTNASDTQITYEIPVMITASEAKELANRALWAAWNSRVSHSFTLGPSFFKIEPGDVGTVAARGLQFTVRAVKVTYNNDFTLSIQSSSFLSDEAVEIIGDAGTGYPQNIPNSFGVESFLIDAQLLRPEDSQTEGNAFGIYVYTGPRAFTTYFSGSTAYIRYNMTMEWQSFASNTVVGFVGRVPAVPERDYDHLQTDRVNTITITRHSGDIGELESATEAQVREGANMAAWGKNNRWEYVQFETVTDNGDNTYTLSNIRRGVNGSEANMDNHRSGDFFILMKQRWLDIGVVPMAKVEDNIFLRTSGSVAKLSPTKLKHQKLLGNSSLPWPPSALECSRSISAGTGDLTFTWQRRSRTIDGIIDNAANSPLGDYESNDYKVSIKRWPYYDNWDYSGGMWNGSYHDDTVVEFLVTNDTELVLTAAQIRSAELYEFDGPDVPTSSGSTFSQQPGSYIAESETINEQIVDLGYGQFVAFKYLDVMIQQKTSIPNSSGYGPGYWKRVYIKDL